MVNSENTKFTNIRCCKQYNSIANPCISTGGSWEAWI